MEITNVGVRLVTGTSDRLKAFCTITIDDSFVVRDLKVVDGPNGLFVAMPSRKRTQRCPRCSHKNEVRARYCNECAAELPPERGDRTHDGKPASHTDIAHPINSECRELIQRCVLEAYDREAEEFQTPVSTHGEEEPPTTTPPPPSPPSPPSPTTTTRPSPSAPPGDDDAFGAGIL